MPSAESDTPVGRSLKALGAAWALAGVIGVVQHLFHFHSGIGTALGSSIFLPLLGALLGPFVGLFFAAPYFTLSFKAGLGLALCAAAGLFFAGVRGRPSWWRWCMCIGGALLWMVAGLMGFGPQ